MTINRKVSSRELRRRLQADSALLRDQAAPAIGSLLHNDQVTQKRVQALEARVTAFQSMGWTQRLMWVLRGTV